MENKEKIYIASSGDLHIRFGSRHLEYEKVFDKFLEDLKGQKEIGKLDRLILNGDLMHQKATLSSPSLKLLSRLLIGASNIVPVDIITGNHDVNLQQIEQGIAVNPLFDIVDLIQKEEDKRAYIVNQSNKDKINFWKNAVYYYTESGFYKIRKDLAYGVYSLLDGKIIKLENKEPGVFYVALFHGAVYGGRADNGIEMKSEDAVKLSTFAGFDVVTLSDFHSYQTFDRDEELVIDEKELDEYKAKGWQVVGAA